jgi:peptide/nickel transport system permease protein
LRAIVALWGISTIVFVVMRLSGDPVPLMLPPDAPPSEIFRVRAELGLDQPLPVQYLVYFGNLLRGDLGRSIHMRLPAMQVAAERLPATLELALGAFVLAVVVAIPAGLVSAAKRNSLWDNLAMGLALLGQSAPTFYIGIMLILVLGLELGLFPISGRGQGTWGIVGDWPTMLRHLALPAVTLGAFAMASIARLTRSAVLEVMRQDFIRTARAKGLNETFVLLRHNLKNAAIPIITIMGLQFGTLLGGAVVTETVFSWPGIGRLAIQSIFNRDYPVVQSAVILVASFFVLVNFMVDLAYGWLDPRIRYG